MTIGFPLLCRFVGKRSVYPFSFHEGNGRKFMWKNAEIVFSNFSMEQLISYAGRIEAASGNGLDV